MSERNNLTLSQEALLKTLSTMTLADTNIAKVELEAVLRIFKEEVGIELAEADVRIAAKSEYIEDQEIGKYLKGIEKKLSLEEKKQIMRSLIKVVKADQRTCDGEVAMFNSVANALKLTPADIVNL